MRIELPRERYQTAGRMGGPERSLTVEGQRPADVGNRPHVTMVAVGRPYFEALGIAPRHGRAFEPLDGTPGRAAVAGGQIMQSIMGGVSGSDPATLTAVPALLVVVAFAACLIPARRAMRVNPVEALRSE